MALNPIDLRIDTYSTGNRGFIAKPEIGVRITHIPTGIVAECSKYRSQHLNREEALGMLEIKLKETKVPSVPQAIAAVKTLECLGYAYHSAEFWKPPVKPLEPSKPKMEAIAEVIEELENDGNGWCAKVRWLCNPVPVGEQLYWPKPQTSATVEQLVLLDTTKYQMPEHTKIGTTFLNVFVSQADSQPVPQGETNVQLDIDSNHSTPEQQRDVAGSVALGQPVGNRTDQAASHLGTQGDKLLIVAERNIRSFLRSAVFKSESDREAALNCVDVLWEAASAPADNVTAPAGWTVSTPVFAFRRKGLDDFCTCTEERYAELSAKPNLFEVRVFYTAPPPQAVREPLPTDVELMKTISKAVRGLTMHRNGTTSIRIAKAVLEEYGYLYPPPKKDAETL